MLIHANQATTSHQYNIWTKDIVWKQLYGLLCEFCEDHDENPSLACKNPYFIFTNAKLMSWH